VKGTIQIDGERCKGCALCVDFCPKDCVRISDELNLKGYFVAAFDEAGECNACRHCALMCPDVAIEVSTS
jgi:2-oxoglutarate ferredoxin oxidoreductase subunit delta